MIDMATLRARAKRRYARVERERQDPRYRRVVGRFKTAGLLDTNFEVPDNRNPVAVDDALWAGRLEPRVLELLPALIVKKPSLFAATTELPKDLSDTVRKLRRNEMPDEFRGIPGPDLAALERRVLDVVSRGATSLSAIVDALDGAAPARRVRVALYRLRALGLVRLAGRARTATWSLTVAGRDAALRD